MSPKIGPREEQLRALRARRQQVDRALPRRPAHRIPEAAPAAPEPAPEASAPVKPKETTTMKTPKKAKKKAAARKGGAGKQRKAPASAKAPGKGKTRPATDGSPTPSSGLPRPGSKNEIIFNMVRAPQGATEAAICKELGWQRCRVTLNRVCKKAGATLTSEGTGAERVYRATMPAV